MEDEDHEPSEVAQSAATEEAASALSPSGIAPSAPPSVKRVALGVCGGIAAYKAAEVLRGLQRRGCDVRVCMTERAVEFVRPLTFRALSGAHVIVDDYAPENPDPIAHITFSQTIDLLLIAPATANTIAKFANGIADDFLTSTYLAATAPVLIAPAMNTRMWQHPATVRNVAQLRADGVHFVMPDAGEMACGTVGPGRLSEPEMIVRAALEILQPGEEVAAVRRDLAGEHILITVGATREAIDPVRFLSNRSSGRMGFALATAAKARGAEVTVVAGATSADESQDIEIIRVTSAEEMRTAVRARVERASVFIAAAAVADYRPAFRAPQKIKKHAASLILELERTPDILAEVARHKRDDQLIVGFAAETYDVLPHARKKLHEKNLDLIVANDVTQDGAGFESDTNIISLVTRERDEPLSLPLMSKADAAERILDEVIALRAAKRPPSIILTK